MIEVTMSYALATLWHERQRFLPGILAVAFSALLIALQCGLLLGLFSITSLTIDETSADVWVGHPEVYSVDLGRPIPAAWQAYLNKPEVASTEMFIQSFQYWSKPTGGAELCLIIGSGLSEDSMGAVKLLGPEFRALLTEPGSVVVDESEFERLGVEKIGDTAEVKGQRVKIVGTVQGYKSLAGPYIFCSFETARKLIGMSKDQTIFILARCHSPEEAQLLVKKLQAPYLKTKLAAFTAPEFSLRSRLHWLTKTKAGIALGCAAALGLLVGAVVTSQTLYAATIASLREYAVLRAMGIPRWRMALTVLAQSFWVGVAGIFLALPTVFALGQLAIQLGAKVLLPWELLSFAVGVTMFMALVAGLTALRSLRQIEPVALLR
jgi:putative ABC transport system permease protein